MHHRSLLLKQKMGLQSLIDAKDLEVKKLEEAKTVLDESVTKLKQELAQAHESLQDTASQVAIIDGTIPSAKRVDLVLARLEEAARVE
jgi:hypothetical protein